MMMIIVVEVVVTVVEVVVLCTARDIQSFRLVKDDQEISKSP